MKIWIKNNKVLLLDDTDYDYSDMHPGAYIWDGHVPEGVSCQFVVVDDSLVFDEKAGGPLEPDPRDEIIAQQRADIDYLMLLVI